MKEIHELSVKITLSLDEINVLEIRSNVAMTLQKFHQIDVSLDSQYRTNFRVNDREIYERIMIQVVHNQKL